MELYRPHREEEKIIKHSFSSLLVAAAGAAVFIIIGAMLIFITGRPVYLYQAIVKAAHTVNSSFLGGVPRFLNLTVEKNGVDYTLGPRDRLEITYRDEFAVKQVATDSLFLRGITVDIEGAGSLQDFGILQKGVDVIDSVLTAKVKEPQIIVRFRNSPIAAIPIVVSISPQDWLRFAKKAPGGKEKIEYLEKALSLQGEDIEARRSLARMYIDSGETRKGIAQYWEILDKKPGDMNALIELSDVYMHEKRYKDAVALYGKITAMNGRDHAAYANMAYAHGQLGNWVQAVRSYEMSLAVNPGSTDVRYRLAEAYEKQNDIAKAAIEYEQILKITPNAKYAMLKLADHYLRSGSFDKAIVMYQGVLKQEPGSATVFANLGLAYGGKGILEKEIESYKKSISINPRDPVVHYNLALACEKAGKFPAAEEELRNTMLLRPGDADAAEKLALYHEKRRENKKAIDLLKKAAAGSVRQDIYMRLARLYGEEKDFKHAALNYELALRHGAKESEVAKKMTELKIKMLQQKYGD
ncbi:MAG: tetratricopeptide repeat protein [Deltaproteobacteria bacterium]|nr:tetratricopeptide repeat protein [Deltaproteobacteria bacterium]